MIDIIKADNVILSNGTKVWIYPRGYIGCYPGILSAEGKYQGILHPDMLKSVGSETDCGKRWAVGNKKRGDG